jgi:hypothetical protein
MRGRHEPFWVLAALPFVAPHHTRDRGMREQSPVAIGDAQSGIGGRTELPQRPSLVHRYRHFQQETIASKTYE